MDSIYDINIVEPMWRELDDIGVKPLTSAAALDNAMAGESGTVLIVINSVCGCAAGSARPGVAVALQNRAIPDRLYTVFAGVDREATQRARQYMKDMPPSSPSVALFKDGELVYMLHRKQIEMMDVNNIAHNLRQAFEKFCISPGPSVPPETLARVFNMSRV